MSEQIEQAFSVKPIPLPTDALGDDNRQWVHICPNGKIATRDGRGPFYLHNADRVIQASKANSGAAKMLVDYDHQSLTIQQKGKTAIAAGWIVGMQSRKNGIWALVEWTKKAADHIRAHEYRYLSPVLMHMPDNGIARIENVALTNSPALHELTALASKENKAMTTQMSPEELTTMVTQIREMLGLGEDVDFTEIMKALKATLEAKQKMSVDLTKFVPIGQFEEAVKEANSLRQGIHRSQAETYVEDKIRAGSISPAFREWGIDLCTRDKPSFDAFLKRTGPAFEPLFKAILPSSYPEGGLGAGSNGLSSDEQTVCERMGITPEQFNRAR